jgi:hypothetical protein
MATDFSNSSPAVNATPTAYNILVADASAFLPATALDPVASRLLSKVITVTRDMTAVTGDVAYTGVGFTPTSMFASATAESTYSSLNGICDSAKNQKCVYQVGTGFYDGSSLIDMEQTLGTARQIGVLKSFNADGFTITWTKTGSPTGNAACKIICFR